MILEGFSIKIEYYPQNNEIVIVKLSGYVDQSNSHQIEKVISDLIQSNRQKFVFDLSQLIYMSSAGWGIFVGEIKSVRDIGGDIKIAAMSPEVYDVFQILEFYHILEDFSSVDDAALSYMDSDGPDVADLIEPEQPFDSDNDIDNLLEFSGVTPAKKPAEDNQGDTVQKTQVKKRVDAQSEHKGPQKQKQAVPHARPVATQAQKEMEIDISKLPFSEKIRRIIAIYPLLNVFQIKKMLSHEKFGYTKIGALKLYKTLRELNLHNKKLRYRFYRST